MTRSTALALLLALLVPQARDASAVTFTETFDTQTHAGTIDPSVWWNTSEGLLTLQPRALTAAGSLAGMPGNSVDLVLRGDRVYMAAQNAGVLVMNVQTPSSPSLYVLWSYGTVNGLDVQADLAALATTNGTWILDISDVAFPTVLYTNIGEQVGAVELDGNRMYVGLDDSLRILDISNPSAPVQLGSVPLPGTAYRMDVHGHHVYCARGSELSIVDVSDPANPVVVGSDANGSSFVDVQVDGGYAYATIVDTGVRTYDVSDPANPLTLATYAPGNFVYGLDVSGDALYVAWRGDGVLHLDVSDPADPRLVSSIDTPGSAEGLVSSGPYTYVADGTGLQVLTNAGSVIAGTSAYAAAGDPQKVAVQGRHAYLAEDAGGLSIVSLFRDTFAQRVGHLPLEDARDVAVGGHFAFIANGGYSFVIADVSDPANPVPVFTNPAGIGTVFEGVELDGHLAYVRRNSIVSVVIDILDVSDPTSPVALGSFGAGFGSGLAVEGGLAAIEVTGQLRLYDVSDPAAPALIGTTSSLGPVVAAEFEGDVLYLAGGNRFRSFDVSDPTAPALIDTLSHPGTSRDLVIEGDDAWIATDASGGYRISVAQPGALASVFSLSGPSRGIALHGEMLFQARDDGNLTVWKYLNRRYQSLSGDAASANVNPLPDPVLAGRLTPVHTRAMTFELSSDGGSNYTPADSAQWTYFGAPGPDVRWFVDLSAARPGNDPRMTELTLDMLYAFGQVAVIEDVGNDQGRQVRITWERSAYDRVGSPEPILEYDVYRKQVPGLAPAAAVRPEGALAAQLAGWDYLTTIPARAEDLYSAVVPTLADSTAAAGIAWSTFMVRAVTGAIGVHYDSYADSGYSIDNLAPAVPANPLAVYGGGGNQLSWDPPVDADVQYFRIYRDTDPDFVPGPGFLVGLTAVNGWTDPDWDTGGVFYRISAVDFAGNESGFAAPEGPTTGVDDGGLPAALRLHPGAPNPFRSSTTLRFALPADADVALGIFDVGGRRVRVLARERFDAGVHAVSWDGRDDAGRALAPGLYLARLAAAGETRITRIVRME